MTAAVEVVQAAYAAFQRGDIPGVLALLHSDVSWSYYGAVPWAGTRSGRASIPEFFQILGSTLDFEEFRPEQFVFDGSNVAVFGVTKAKVRATGNRHDEPGRISSRCVMARSRDSPVTIRRHW